MFRHLPILTFSAIAAWALASCSNVTSAPTSADAGVEVGGADSAEDLALFEAADEPDSSEAGPDASGSTGDATAWDASVQPDLTTAPDSQSSDVATCPIGTACSAPCCPSAACDGVGTCVCAKPACDDQNACTVDVCEGSTCTHLAANATPCDDSNPCTLSDACTVGTCQGLAMDCADADPCTVDACVNGGCTHLPTDGGPCDDFEYCTGPGTCLAGLCAVGSPVDCDDGNKCTVDFCEEYLQGCGHTTVPVDGDLCNLPSLCPVTAMCKDGTCQAVALPTCDDWNPCTTDACDPVKGCVHLANSDTCSDDGNPCTVDVCAGGKCGVVKKDGTSCASGTGCDAAVTCQQGKCLGGQEVWTVDLPYFSVAGDMMLDGKPGVPVSTPNSVVTYAWNGSALWELPMKAGSPLPIAQGWAFEVPGPALSIVSDAGVLLSTAPWPVNGAPGGTIDSAAGADLLISIWVEGESSILQIGQDGTVKQKWAPPEGWRFGGVGLRQKNGDSLWQVRKVPQYFWKSSAGLARFNVTGKAVEPFIGPLTECSEYVAGFVDGEMHAAEGPDLSLYIAQWRRTANKPGNVSVFVWHLTSAGGPLWGTVLPMPDQPSISDAGDVAIVALADGTVEVLAGAHTYNDNLWIYNQGYTSWRLAADGRLLWSRDEDQRRRPYGGVYGKGLGTIGVSEHHVGTNTYPPPRLTRSDAFGNLTCAESGPCWDKPATYCDDGDPCTNDLCGAQWKGCHHEPFADGMPCTPGKTCKKGQCVP